MKEIAYVRKKGVWRKIPRSEARKRGIKIVSTRWIDINKGDKWNPNYRSRFVAKEYNNGRDGEGNWFAATPPLEALKLLISDAATRRPGHTKRAVMINDVARAFFEAPATREICIELPEEDWEEADAGKDLVDILDMGLYGTREAAANVQHEVEIFMTTIVFRQGRYNACTFWYPQRDVKAMLHGDDFVSTGEEHDLEWLKEEMVRRFEIKTQIIGHDHTKEGGS